MTEEYLKVDEAKKLVQEYMKTEGDVRSTQEILSSGAIPRLKGYIVRPGKVSDSIFGGSGTYEDKKTGEKVIFDNPELTTKDGKQLRIMVRTDRISTHDINRGSIPFKDQILATNHNYMRNLLKGFIGTSQIDVPGLADNAVVIGAENLQQIAYENVIRAYMAKSSTPTSLYFHFMDGEREYCGHTLRDDLIINGPLPYVMDTPSTKSDEHDESVSPQWLFDHGICTPEQYDEIKKGSLAAYCTISRFLGQKGLIAVDTKTEHGINSNGQIVSQDEIWTMDSSRFWKEEDYKKQFDLFMAGKEDRLVKYIIETQPGIKEKDYIVDGRAIITPKSYSKEFARGFSKGDQGYTADQRMQISVRYIEGIQELLGQRFRPDMRSREERVTSGLQTLVEELV